MTKRSVVEYLADRLQKINESECQAAFNVATTALTNFQQIEISSTASEDLFHTMWGHVTRALDYGEYPRQFERELDAMEAELAGHVLTSRLQRGAFALQPHINNEAPRPSAFRTWLDRFF